jgi:HD-like signal output (HDOD) protein
MVVVAPDDYARVIATAHEQDCPWQQAEMSAFGYDHADVGAALAQRWNFPEDIRQALAFHHAPSGGTPGGPAGLIHYADAIAKALDLDGAEDTQLPHLDPATIDALDLDQHTLARVLAETQEGFDHCSLLLG